MLPPEERIALRTKRNVETGCLEWWKGTRYPSFKVDGKPIQVSRWVWANAHGPIPPGLMVRHTCDNPKCVEVTHLLIGTMLDNGRDAVERKRYPRLQKDHCPAGHVYDGTGQRGHNVYRTCSVCVAESNARTVARRIGQRDGRRAAIRLLGKPQWGQWTGPLPAKPEFKQ